jgi:hypothetical protein
MPSLLRGGSMSRSTMQKAKGVTPFMKKKENAEDKARVVEL